MAKYIMSITAQDKAGIVERVTEAGMSFGANIEAASQTVHQGYFAMIVLWSVGKGVCGEDLCRGVKEKCGGDIHVYVTEYMENQACSQDDTQSFIITCIGPDKPGILHTLSSYLVSKDINIDDLYSCVADGGDFVVICQVSIPANHDVFMLQADLESVGESSGVAIEMQHENIFVATNGLPLRRSVI